jgi:hypothetical protein
MRKKYIRLVVVLALALLVGTASAASTSLSIGDSSGSPGSTVEVPINIAGASNIGSMDIVLTYDSSVLGVSSVGKGELTKNSMLQSNADTPGIIAIGIADTDGINGDGSVAVITFNVLGELGSTSPLTLYSAKANDVNTLVDILITKTSGTFMVTEKVVTEKGITLSPVLIGIVALVLVLVVAIVALRRRK